MEKKFTFRFYDVTRDNDAIPTMVSVLNQIAAIPVGAAREKTLTADYTIRLENYEADGEDAVVGELVRCQNTNLPSEVSAEGRSELSAARLGHSIVFRLNHRLGRLGIQYDRRIISPGRLLDYLVEFDPTSLHGLAPIISQEAWQKFNSGPTRKLMIKIANPSDMNALAGAGQAASSAFKSMAEAYDAPYIGIEMSMGNFKGQLAEATSDLVRAITQMVAPGVKVDKLKAVTVVDDVSEELNLLEELVIAKDTLTIDDRDPEFNWKLKRTYLSQQMRRLVG